MAKLARMGAYDFNFDVPAGETLAPHPDRVKAYEALLPKETFGFAPSVDDRAAWGRWREDPLGKKMLSLAREYAEQPFPDYNDAAFLACLEQEDVTQINTVLPETRRRQVAFFMAEAIYDEGEFLPVLESDIRALAKLSTWIHPNNDLKRLNFELKTYEPDLVVMHFAAYLGTVDHVLGPRLSPATRELIQAETQRRVFDPLRQRIETGRDVYWWIDVKHNWNAVCLACAAEAAMTLLPAADRAWWLAATEALVKNFRDGFTDDGVCTEGVGYWSYGFIHYILLGELLRMGTANTIDLLDEPKMGRVALFPDHVEIMPGVFPTYADCHLGAVPTFWARHWLDNRLGTARREVEPVTDGTDPFDGMGVQFVGELMLWMFRTHDPRRPQRSALPVALRNWFEDAALLVCRPASTTTRRWAATFLGGDNGVNHNHNDLGTFTVVLDGKALVLDPGAEIYSFRTFSANRYDSQLLNSYGHPVPRVAGRLQEAGPQWRATVLETDFTADVDRVVLDLRAGYDVPTLRRLEREFVYDRRGAGSLTIVDRVEFSEPSEFETALITLGQFEIDGARVRLRDGEAAIDANVTIDGAELACDTDTINQPPHPHRIALRCAKPVRSATITTVLRPVA